MYKKIFESDSKIKKILLNLVSKYNENDFIYGKFDSKLRDILYNELIPDFSKFGYIDARVIHILKKYDLPFNKGDDNYKKIYSLVYYLNSYKQEKESFDVIKKYKLEPGQILKKFKVVGGLTGDKSYTNGKIINIQDRGYNIGNVSIEIKKGTLSIPASRLEVL